MLSLNGKIEYSGIRSAVNGIRAFGQRVIGQEGRSSVKRFGSYSEALAACAVKDKKDIILALTDSATLSMAMNFYETSIASHGIKNILFISSDSEACDTMQTKFGIPCFLYMEDKGSKHKSEYNTKEFKRKMNIRTFMILEALQLGYTVLHTDTDIVWARNPLNDLHVKCDRKCDVAALWDCGAMNAGFVYVRPTPLGISLYKLMNNTAMTTGKDDQTAFNQALRAHKSQKLNLVTLPSKSYQCGRRFWEDERRMFAGDNPCKNCIVIHNNWIVTVEAKVYRFKEMHLWLNDENGYYSNTDKKYLTYSNVPSKNGSLSATTQIENLEKAFTLGFILNRIVILPSFYCDGGPINILKIIMLKDLDAKCALKYREHAFINHPKVPSSVKESISSTMVLGKPVTPTQKGTRTFKPSNTSKGYTMSDIKSFFNDMHDSVLVFQSFENVEFEFPRTVSLASNAKQSCSTQRYRQFH